MFNTNLYFLILIHLILMSTMLEFSVGNCVSEDGLMRNVSAEWINGNGCRCSCIELEDLTFSHCECKPKGRNAVSQTPINKICHSNGFEYFPNETWMSSVSPCEQCKCQTKGEVACGSEKHCSNPCPLDQIPRFGPCCEVLQCSQKSLSYANNIKCRDPTTGISVSQGKEIVRRHSCIDRICICYNGDWVCHNYCQLSNGTFKFWHRLCCSRSIGTQQCTSYNQTLFPGEKGFFEEMVDNCTCLDGILYCDKSYLMNHGIVFNTTSSPHSNKSLAILITLLCFIGFIFCCFIMIIFFNNFEKLKQKVLKKDSPKNDVLLSDIQDVDPKISESPIDRI